MSENEHKLNLNVAKTTLLKDETERFRIFIDKQLDKSLL
jgi:hypothetical protein